MNKYNINFNYKKNILILYINNTCLATLYDNIAT